MKTGAESQRAEGLRARRSNRTRVLAIALTPVAVAACIAWLAHAPSRDPKQRLVDAIGRTLRDEAYATGVDFGRWNQLVADRAGSLAVAQSDEQIASTLNQALGEFGVSHLSLLTPREASERAAGKRLGAGLAIQRVSAGWLVCSVVAGGPAAAAALEPGDIITAVRGAPVGEVPELSGEAGQSIDVAWISAKGEQRKGALRLREHRRASMDGMTWIEPGVALIGIHSFADELYDRARVQSMFDQAARATGIVLDLRSNRGGNAANVEHLLGQVVRLKTAPYVDIYREDWARWNAGHGSKQHPAPTSGEILRFVAPNGRSLTEPPDETVYDGPLVVLVDGQCGSGGELAPASLQRIGRGKILGSRTRGKVRIGQNIALPGGYELQTPIGEFVTMDGDSIEGRGVTPDVELPPEQTALDGVILPLAVRTLKGA